MEFKVSFWLYYLKPKVVNSHQIVFCMNLNSRAISPEVTSVMHSNSFEKGTEFFMFKCWKPLIRGAIHDLRAYDFLYICIFKGETAFRHWLINTQILKTFSERTKIKWKRDEIWLVQWKSISQKQLNWNDLFMSLIGVHSAAARSHGELLFFLFFVFFLFSSFHRKHCMPHPMSVTTLS